MYLLGESLVLINPGFSQLYGGATNLGPNTKAGPHGQDLACTIFQRGGGVSWLPVFEKGCNSASVYVSTNKPSICTAAH